MCNMLCDMLRDMMCDKLCDMLCEKLCDMLCDMLCDILYNVLCGKLCGPMYELLFTYPYRIGSRSRKPWQRHRQSSNTNTGHGTYAQHIDIFKGTSDHHPRVLSCAWNSLIDWLGWTYKCQWGDETAGHWLNSLSVIPRRVTHSSERNLIQRR